MTFLEFEIDEKDLAAAKFIGDTRNGLVQAIIDASKDGRIKRHSDLARKLNMDKGSLSKVLNGKGNITLRTLGEIAWALDLEPQVIYARSVAVPASNHTQEKIFSGNLVNTATHQEWGSRVPRKTGRKSLVKPLTSSVDYYGKR